MSGTAAAPRLTLGAPVRNWRAFPRSSDKAVLAQTFMAFELISVADENGLWKPR